MWLMIHNAILAVTTQLAVDQEIPRSVIDIFLLVPFVALILAFLRHIVGLRTIGLFFPIVLSVIFTISGFTYGLLLVFFVALFTVFGRILARPFRLLYLPRSAFVISVVTLGMFWVLIFASAVMPRNPVESVSILAFVVLLLFTEDFLRVQSDRGFRSGLILTAETVLFAVIGAFFLRWPAARDAIFYYPEWLLTLPILAILLNQWNGLRLAELYRFRKIRRKLISR